MRSAMNRTFVRVLSVLFVLGLTTPVVKAAEEHDKSSTTSATSSEATASGESSSSTRAEAEKSEKFPAKYDELISKLDKEIEITAVAADKEENNRTFKVGGENKALLEQIKALKDYRDKLKNCAEDTDKKLAEVLDNYVTSVLESLTVESKTVLEEARDSVAALLGRGASVKKGKFKVSEKVVNTYTLQIRELLEAKAKKHEKSKADFEAQDKALTESLNKVAAILWNSKEEGKFREKIFTADKAKTDESTKAIVEAIDKIKASLEKSEKVCKLSNTSTDGSTDDTTEEEDKDKPAGSKDDEAGPDKGNGEIENPAVDPGKDGGGDKGGDAGKGGGAGGGGGAGAGAGGGAGGDLASAIENALNARGIGNQGFGAGANELQTALAALDQARQFQELQRQADQAAIDALRDNNDFNNDALGRALQALGQQEAPSNRSANRENTEGSPSISPSLDSGKGGGGSNVPPPPPMQQPPPPQPFPFQALQPPPTPAINFPSYGEPKKWDDEPVRRPPVVVPDPNMTARLELEKMKMQLAMAQQQQMMMYGPYGRGATGNVNNVGARLTAFGPRGRSGQVTVRTTRTGARINGTASSGAQATMATGSRTRAPK